jgi:trans-aconitate 2-methyltransferase
MSRGVEVWDPELYGRFADERSRPLHELMARVRAVEPARVVDLGCGDGALTATLSERWPGASVLGVDSSESMLAQAAARKSDRLSFVLGAIQEWRPEEPVDVLVSNAALQWVPHHVTLLPRLVSTLAPGGWLAVQVPGNFEAPSHALLRSLCNSDRWRSQLGTAGRWPSTPEPTDYVRELAGLGCSVDSWETTYAHVLAGPDPVLAWMRGTALRPVLARLSSSDGAEFEAEFGALLREAYPARPYGTVLPFRRIFAVAQVRA